MKYQLGEEKEFNGVKMRRVVAMIAIASKGVNPGDVGGWVESEQNLSQVSDEAWVSGSAMGVESFRPTGDRTNWIARSVPHARKQLRRDWLLLRNLETVHESGKRYARIKHSRKRVHGCYRVREDQIFGIVKNGLA